MTERESPRGPLHGVRVVELATTLMAPYACQILGDLGAEVVKVETHEGDPSRFMAGGGHPQLSGAAVNLHRNKRSLAVDLKQPQGSAVLDRLLKRADVLVTNMRPSALMRLGLDYEQLAERHSHLVYVEARGFSRDSDRADEAAYDDTIQALSGIPRLNETLGLGVSFVPVLLADKVSGLAIVQGVLAALLERAGSGRGQRVEIAMLDYLVSFALTDHLGAAAFPGGRVGYSRILTANRGPHRTADGWIAIMPYLDRHWRVLFDHVGAGALLDAPEHADMAIRHRHADVVYGQLKQIVAERTTQEWLVICRELDVPVAEVPALEEIIEGGDLYDGAVTWQHHPVVGDYRAIRQPIRFSQTPASAAPLPAPLVGQDSLELLAELGFDESASRELLATGVVLFQDAATVVTPAPVTGSSAQQAS